MKAEIVASHRFAVVRRPPEGLGLHSSVVKTNNGFPIVVVAVDSPIVFESLKHGEWTTENLRLVQRADLDKNEMKWIWIWIGWIYWFKYRYGFAFQCSATVTNAGFLIAKEQLLWNFSAFNTKSDFQIRHRMFSLGNRILRYKLGSSLNNSKWDQMCKLQKSICWTWILSYYILKSKVSVMRMGSCDFWEFSGIDVLLEVDVGVRGSQMTARPHLFIASSWTP